jgi:hypothetical protein
VAHAHVRFAAYEDVAVLAVEIGEQVESEDYGAIGAVLKRYNSAIDATVLYCGENILDGGLWGESIVAGREGVKGCLDQHQYRIYTDVYTYSRNAIHKGWRPKANAARYEGFDDLVMLFISDWMATSSLFWKDLGMTGRQ